MSKPAREIPLLSDNDKERFFKKISPPNENGCHIWTAGFGHNGYGLFSVKRVNLYRAHRVAWSIVNGSPPSHLQVCHKCDIPACVNPDHLFLGTQLDNMRDMSNKGRKPTGDKHYYRRHPDKTLRGDRNGRAKLTELQVLEIIQKLKKGESSLNLSFEFKISRSTIRFIELGKTWKYLQPTSVDSSANTSLKSHHPASVRFPDQTPSSGHKAPDTYFQPELLPHGG